MNLILEKTDHLSDIETNWTPSGFSPNDQWCSGEELAAFFREYEVQFIRGPFSSTCLRKPLAHFKPDILIPGLRPPPGSDRANVGSYGATSLIGS
jgi:hypothetical protein